MEYEVMPPIDDGPEPLLFNPICSNPICIGLNPGCPGDIEPLCGANLGCSCGGGGSW